MTGSDIFDWVIRAITLLGIPSVVIYFVRDRRKILAQVRSQEAAAGVAEETAPMQVRSTSIVTLEAELAAMSNSFNTDRKIKDETIQFITKQLEEARHTSAQKDEKIRLLEEKVSELQHRVKDLSDDLARVSDDLADLHKPTSPDSA